MIVLDASAAVEWLLRTMAGYHIEQRIYSRGETLHAPCLLDVEVVQVLRRLSRQNALQVSRADEAVADLQDLSITRYDHVPLLPKIWRYRNNLTAYDASYVVLAEHLGATLITRDLRIASAPQHAAKVELF